MSRPRGDPPTPMRHGGYMVEGRGGRRPPGNMDMAPHGTPRGTPRGTEPRTAHKHVATSMASCQAARCVPRRQRTPYKDGVGLPASRPRLLVPPPCRTPTYTPHTTTRATHHRHTHDSPWLCTFDSIHMKWPTPIHAMGCATVRTGDGLWRLRSHPRRAATRTPPHGPAAVTVSHSVVSVTQCPCVMR